MTLIRDQARIGARLMIAAMVVAVVTAGLVVQHVRYGGPMFRKYALQDELIGDILPPPMYEVEAYLEASLILTDPGETEAHARNLAQLESDYRTRRVYWQAAALTAEEQATLNAADAQADAFWDAVDHRYLPAARAGDRATVQRVHDAELAPAYRVQHAAILKLVDQSNAFSASEHGRDNGLSAGLLALAGLCGLGLVAAIVGLARALRVRVVAPLGETAGAMARMADGDFLTPVDGLDRDDEIGAMARALEVFRAQGQDKARAEADRRAVVAALSAAVTRLAQKDLEVRLDDPFPADYEALRADFNAAIGTLRVAMAGVRVGSTGLMRSIHEIRAASEDLARRNEQQAASLEETAASMNEVSSAVRGAADSTAHVRSASIEAHRQASAGGDVVTRAISAMAAIEGSSQEIGQIVNVIDGIAFQTNLLALNAGVEAARAGDAGRGFAVVANEVRALAQRSAEAARDIKALILNSSTQVASGVELVGETGAVLRGIVEQVGAINGLIEGIADASVKQSLNVQQVNGAVGEMDLMTQKNAAMVEQSSAATRHLADEAGKLAGLVASFRTRDVKLRPAQGGSGLRRMGNAVGGTVIDLPPPMGASRAAAVAAPAVVGSGHLAVKGDDWSAF